MKELPYIDEIIELYKGGMSQKAIAEKYNTYNTTIRRILIRNNVRIRSSAHVSAYVKHNPFKRNDEKSDYFLGLLITDGCISNNTITLSLKEEDVYMLQEFAGFCGSKVNVIKWYHSKHQRYQYQVSFKDSRHMVIDYLQRKGNFTNKTFECKLYCPINYNILRGIIDGDGSMEVHKSDILVISVCSMSKQFIDQIAYFYDKNNYHYSIYRRKDGLYYIKIHRIEDLLRLGCNLYHNAHIFLKRKYERWSHFAEMRGYNNTLNSGKEIAIQP